MKWYWVAGTRTNGSMWSELVVAIRSRTVSTLQPVCSMSYIMNSAPASAERRAMPGVQNSKVMVPMTVPPSLRVRLTLLGFIR